MGLKCSNAAVMDNDNWNCQMPLSMTAAIGLKIFKLIVVLLEHLISQLPLSWTAALRTTFVFNLVSKLILEFFFQIKYFGLKLGLLNVT